MSEEEYYDHWLEITKLRLILRPLSVGKYSVEIEGGSYSYKKKEGKKVNKYKRKHVGIGSCMRGGKMDLFRTIRNFDTCHATNGNWGTPYYMKG